MTKMGPVPLDISKNVSVTNVFQDVSCDACDPCYAMCFTIHINQHSQHLRNYKNQRLGNRMEGDTEDLTVQGLEDREIDLISRKV